MDPVLNRPLFRKKALHQEQIRQNKIPGFMLLGVVPISSGFRKSSFDWVIEHLEEHNQQELQ
jgi:hypothetical protein